MKLSAQTTNTLKFGLMMLIFSFLVFMAYSSGKKITDNHKKRKTSYYFIILSLDRQQSTLSLSFLTKPAGILSQPDLQF